MISKSYRLMLQKFFITLFSFAVYNICLGQDSSLTRKMELKVLSTNQIGKKFRFNVSKKKDERNIVELKYLGRVQAKADSVYKILTWARIWGPNFHTTGVVMLFNVNNEYMGKYVLGDMSDLPSKVEKNNLIFTNKLKSGCSTTLITKISFDNGIPQDIFLRCQEDGGDIYSFQTTE